MEQTEPEAKNEQPADKAEKKSVAELRSTLNDINKEKEAWFEKKDTISKQIREKIKLIQDTKQKRDEFTQKVRELKETRNKMQGQVKEKIDKIKTIDKEKKVLAKDRRKNDPSRLKKEIEKIELRLETEAMSFDAERKLGKKLKEMKKEYATIASAIENRGQSKELNKEIKGMKKDTDSVHSEVQKYAQESQTLHEKILAVSKEVDALKKDEKEAFEHFKKEKKKFSEVNAQLKEELKTMGISQEKTADTKKKDAARKEAKKKEMLKEKEKEVEKKIKTKKKLTTEDLLVFQNPDKKE